MESQEGAFHLKLQCLPGLGFWRSRCLKQLMGKGHLLGQALEPRMEWPLQVYISYRVLTAACPPLHPGTTQQSV